MGVLRAFAFLFFQPFEATRDLQALLAGFVAGYGNLIHLDGQLAAATTGAAATTRIEDIFCAVAQARAAVERLKNARGLPHLCVQCTTAVTDLQHPRERMLQDDSVHVL